MKLLILFSVFFSFETFAGCEIYTRYGEDREICWISEYKGYLSKKCSDKCEARSFLDKHMPKPEKIDRNGGKNPAAQICKTFGYKVAVLKSPRMSEQSYCEFPDGTLVDTNALVRSLK